MPINPKLIRNFIFVGKSEGYSFLFLLFIAMPLKYFFQHPEFVRIAGSIHGILFIAFLYFILQMYLEQQLSFKKSTLAVFLSFLPFGTFFLRKLIS